MSAHLRLVKPRHVNRTVPTRPANSALRTREYLTANEVEKLIGMARRNGRYGHRDATLILIAFRHGLRASELCDLKSSQVEFGRNAVLHVRRAKNGKPAAHPIRGDELRALRELHRQYPDSGNVFTTERHGPFTPDAVNRLIKRIGERADLDFHARHPGRLFLSNAPAQTMHLHGGRRLAAWADKQISWYCTQTFVGGQGDARVLGVSAGAVLLGGCGELPTDRLPRKYAPVP